MTTLTIQQIKEVSEQLDCGLKCFWNRKTNELLFVPDTDKYPEVEDEEFAEELEKLDTNFEDYVEIESMPSRESYDIMVEFMEQVIDAKLKNQLANALNRNKPFREFKDVLDESGEQRTEWFSFKNEKLNEWVVKQLDYLSRTNEEQ